MGLFLFVAAVKGKKPLEIAASIKIYLDQIGFDTEIKSAEKWREEIKLKTNFDVIDPMALTAIFNLKNNFSAISFDNCPFQEIEVCKHVSNQLNTIVSLIEVYDSSTWYHRLFQNGNIIDIFCNNPEEFEGNEQTSKFEGNPSTLSEIFRINKLEIEQYMFQFTNENRVSNISRKISTSDDYSLENEWFFIDFWKKLGIDYPKSSPQFVLLHKIK
ncbi:MAG: hypothetical protein KGD73_11025 [Candidatus Lokiarchaeota archaeon]|nr:hypothetical protein [Candidatus Lokiarchaeota archaeon]